MVDIDALASRRNVRIAIIYDNAVRPDTTGEYCRRALEALGHTVSHYSPSEARDIPPVYTFYLRVDDDLDYDLPDALHPLAYWAIDTHRDYARRVERARAADWVFCAQQDGAGRMREAGLRSVHWLPLACDPTVHRRIPGVRKEYDICFVGNTFAGDGNRTGLVEWIRTEFPRAFIGQAYGDEMARIYSASRFVFNCAIRNDVNMRVFEATACGSLLLTNDLTENGQNLLFRPGAHLLTYQQRADLQPLIQQFQRDENERERIAEAGMRHAHMHHTYGQRMTDLLNCVLNGQDLGAKYPVASVEHGRMNAAQGEDIAGNWQLATGSEQSAEARGRILRRAQVERAAKATPQSAIDDRRSAMRRSPVPDPQPLVAGPRQQAGRPRVSIVIPTFNNLHLTRECLGSIRGSTEIPYEIIVVDNGSSDGTARWARGEGLRVIANPDNYGFPRACNQGIGAADGDYVLLLNNDTCVARMWLERLVAHAEADTRVGLVGPSTNFAAGCQQIAVTYSTAKEFLGFAEQIALKHAGRAEDAPWLVGLCLLIPRRVVDAVGLLDERFGLGNYEDNDYCLRVRMAGYCIVWAQDVFIHHAGHQSFKQLGDGFQRLLAENEQRFKRKWDLDQYRQTDEQRPQGPDRAWSLLKAERFRDAYDAFEAQVRANPTDTRAFIGLGLAAEGRGVPAAAALAYRTVLRVAPEDGDAARGLARVSGVPAGGHS